MNEINREEIYKKLISENACTTNIDNYTIETYKESGKNDCLYVNLKYKINQKYNDYDWLVKQINQINMVSMSFKIFVLKDEININTTIMVSGKISPTIISNTIEKSLAFSKSIDQTLEYLWSLK